MGFVIYWNSSNPRLFDVGLVISGTFNNQLDEKFSYDSPNDFSRKSVNSELSFSTGSGIFIRMGIVLFILIRVFQIAFKIKISHQVGAIESEKQEKMREGKFLVTSCNFSSLLPSLKRFNLAKSKKNRCEFFHYFNQVPFHCIRMIHKFPPPLHPHFCSKDFQNRGKFCGFECFQIFRCDEFRIAFIAAIGASPSPPPKF